MLERLISESTAVMTVLEQSDHSHLKLSGTQWDLAKQVTAVLKPLQIATTALSMEQNPSISCVYPVVHGLINLHLQSSDGDAAPTKKLKTAVAGDLKRHFPMQGNGLDAANNLAWIGSALDPRFKALTFLPDTL